ncbi:MAG TPA: lipocalin family protein, partial [Candidatus Acidoferrales bacterium]|nr:lipocalin family protein [Candidatus Acidoferrales bacterium]
PKMQLSKRVLLAGAGAAAGAAALSLGVATRLRRPALELATVPDVDLTLFTGRWFEIARMPVRFERDSDRNVTAEYTLLPDGSVRIENHATAPNGKLRRARGVARVPNPEATSKLRVKFFPLAPAADYWVIGLDFAYRWAIVSEPNRKHLWVLSRTPGLDGATLERILRDVDVAGYDSTALIRTPQDGA